MTLIVCLKAEDCIVFAADSLSSRGDAIISCTTQKLHAVAQDAVIASAGCSRVLGRNWQEILADFSQLRSGTDPSITTSELQQFLGKVIGEVPRDIHGACRGGNTFLLAGYGVASPGMVVNKLTRVSDLRYFEPVKTVSDAASDNYIEWIGDTEKVSGYTRAKNALYIPNMAKDVAVNFAIAAINEGIAASLAVGNHTIGGEFVSVALVSAGQVELSRHPASSPCTVTT
ncbi:hypothetical protein [Asaia sp. VD9]|uniref:hypothetical protein n=1 Tax=Asaia sp. VD9 TaxID=3081235 RepID=UPI00301A1F42